MPILSDKNFYFPEVRVVEASAGSGKTYCLARRFVELLLGRDQQVPLRNILAITFTNKASFAMKGRILEFLKKIALNVLSPSEEADILGPVGLTQAQARERAFVIMEELIHQYNFFQVQTIDSFINAILSGCAFKIGLSAGFKIKRNFGEFLEYGLDSVLEQVTEDKEVYELFSRFLHQYLFLENKPGWFPKKDILGLLGALYQQGNTYGVDFTVSDIKGEEPIIRKKKIMALLRQLRDMLPKGTDARFVKSLDGFLGRYTDGFDFDEVSDYLSRDEVPVKKGTEVSRELERLWSDVNTRLRQLSEVEAYSLFNPYVEIFNRISVDFYQRAAQEDVLFLPELNRRARALFDEGMVTVEELYYRLATRFRHYLVDEFQDTSLLQWQNLYLMIEEALSSGGSFFYVGDKKQAIYGFRGGEVRLFEEVKAQFSHFNVRVEELRTNYRSQKALVEFNNRVFSTGNLRRFMAQLAEQEKDEFFLTPDDMADVEQVFHSAVQQVCPPGGRRMAGKDGGYVKIEYVDGEKKDDRDDETRERLIALIRALRERFSCRQIAILTRSNQEIEAVTSWLMAEGISVESERTLNIKENVLIQELLSFLKFLDSPVDNLSLARFLAGDIFAAVSGLDKARVHAFLFGLRERMEQEKDFAVYMALREEFGELWEGYFAEFFKSVGLFPLYELTVSVIGRFRILQNFPDQQGFVMRFLELLKAGEEEYRDLHSFLENFEALDNEDLFVNAVDSDSLKILTTHKAKGLEFPVVIIPFLGMKIHGASGGALGQQSYILDHQGRSLQLVRIKKKYLKFSGRLYEIERRERVRSFISELNNIYVALTRAERELYAFIPAKVGSSRNMLAALMPADLLENGSPGGAAEAAGTPFRQQLPLPASEYHDWIGFLKEEFLDLDRVYRREKILKGKVIHFALAQIPRIEKGGNDELLRRALEKARQQYPLMKDVASCEEVLDKIFSTPAFRPFFEGGDGEVYLEQEIVTPEGHTRRVDRLIVKKDEVWVVDYKSSREAAGDYQKQVTEYMAMAAGIYPRHRARGFLLYLDECRVEEVF